MAGSDYKSGLSGLEEKLSFMECALKLKYGGEYHVHRKEDIITLSKQGNIAATIYPIDSNLLFADICGREHYHVEEFLSQVARPYKVVAMLNP